LSLLTLETAAVQRYTVCNGRAESPAENKHTEVNTMKTKQDLIEKAKKEWGETWDEGMIEYDAEYNEYIVWVGKPDIYKAFFDADTLRCIGTKC
jgi:hypothetical protein